MSEFKYFIIRFFKFRSTSSWTSLTGRPSLARYLGLSKILCYHIESSERADSNSSPPSLPTSTTPPLQVGKHFVPFGFPLLIWMPILVFMMQHNSAYFEGIIWPSIQFAVQTFNIVLHSRLILFAPCMPRPYCSMHTSSMLHPHDAYFLLLYACLTFVGCHARCARHVQFCFARHA